MLRTLALTLLLALTAAPAHAQLDATLLPLDPGALGYGVRAAGEEISVRPAVVVDRNRTIGLTISGIALLLGSYVTNVVGGLFAGTEGIFFSRSRDARWEPFAFTSLVPVLGPWIQLAIKPTRIDQDEWATWLIVDGIVQAASVALIAAATATAHVSQQAARAQLVLAIVPSLGPQRASLSVLGCF